MPGFLQRQSVLCAILSILLSLICIVATFVYDGIVSGSTIVSGQILADTTWTVANSPYLVSESVLVDKHVTLTIEPGVVMQFDQGKVLRVEGRLVALGTESAQVVFTSNQSPPSPGDWGGLQLTDSSEGNILRYCVIEFGGRNGLAAVLIQEPSAGIDRCVVRNNGACGLRVEGESTEVTNNAIYGNLGGGLAIAASSVSVRNNVIYANRGVRGGGVYLASSSGTVSANEIRDNSASASGGGVYVSGTIGNVDGNVIAGNMTLGNGGGVYFEGTSGGVTANEIRGNAAVTGGGIYYKGSSTTIAANVIDGNSASLHGGGVYLDGYYNLFYGNTVSSNSATEKGGGLCVLCGNCVSANTIQMNQAGVDGGGVYLTGGSSCKRQAAMLANIIVGNNSNGKGGGASTFGDPQFRYNSLMDNSPFDLAVRDAYREDHVEYTSNWWGVGETIAIQSHIWDWSDSLSLAVVDTWPWLENPVAIDAQNQAPEQPAGVGAPQLGLNQATLTSSEFSDSDLFDIHFASQWQVTAYPGDYSNPVFDSGTNWTALSTIDIGADKLAYSTTYFWRVRYMDSRGAWSEYSSELSFTTNKEPKRQGEVGACACPCVPDQGSTSAAELAAPWGMLGLCATAGLYLVKRPRKG